MNRSGGLYLCLGAILIGNSGTGGNDPLQGNFPTLMCQDKSVVTGCNGTLVNDYKQSNYSTGDKNINEPDTFVFLYTRRNPKCPEFLHKCSGRLPSNTKFRAGKRVIIVVGGYISAVCDLAYFREFKDQFLFRDDYNVILIDWPWGFYPDIFSSFVNAEVVGKQIAFVMMRIMEQTGISEKDFYIVGHSVGAHIGGHAGKYFTLFTGGKKIRRITGLDPAGAAYLKAENDGILDHTDADLVDLIFTNSGDCFPFTFASLYPPLCSHFQATDFYKVSINPCGCQFVGYECENKEQFLAGRCRYCGGNGTRCAVMGFDWENCYHKDVPTVYYLTTEVHCPYCEPYKKRRTDLQGFRCNELNSTYCFLADEKPPVETCTKDD